MKLFTLRSVLAAALLAILVGAGGAWHSRTAVDRFVLEVNLTSTAPGHGQFFYDRGAGFNEADSSSLPVAQSSAPKAYRVPLPPGRLLALRFDPLDREATVVIDGAPRIVSSTGRIVRTLVLADFRAASQIRALRSSDGRLEIAPEPGATDPQLTMELAPPVEIASSWRDFFNVFARTALTTLAVLALLLLALGRVPRPASRGYWAGLGHAAVHAPLWLIVPVCGAILFARQPERFTNPQFWGEDSIIFYEGALLRGWSTLVEPYAGYLHAVPRLAAATSLWLHPQWAPTLFAAIALVGILYVAARTQSGRCPLPRHAGCALAVVLIPDAYEVLMNVDNLQWFLAGGSALLLISADPVRWSQRVHDGCVAALFGLTGPFSILFFGLFVWRAWVRRTWASTVLAGLVTLCAATQAYTIWRNPVVMGGTHIAPEYALAVPGMRLTASLFAGAAVPPEYPLVLASALGVVALAGIAALALRRGTLRPERLWLAAALLLLLAVSLYRCRYVLPDLCHAGYGPRYFYPIVMMLAWLLFAAATDERRWIARTAGGVLLWALLVNLPRLRENAFADLHWKDYAQKIHAGEAVEIPVNPEPWVLRLPARPPQP